MNKYKDLSKEELCKLLEKMESDLKSKKYGLFWDAEREPEEVVLQCAENLPVLKRVKEKQIKTNDEHDNILIQGDNYHALTVLNYTHKGKIDVIYIDPPYNTGNKDFIYNDRYVDKEDGYRHSKWLNFMEKRLNLAKDLLKETGVIFISIDDNEQAQLKMLCDKIFGQENYIGTLIWNKKNVVQNDARFFSTNHEYIHCYSKNLNSVVFNLIPRTDDQKARYANPDNDPKGDWVSVALQAKSGSASNSYEITFENGVMWKPVAGTFPRLSKESLIKAYDEGRLWFGKNGRNVPRLKKYISEVKEGVVSNSILLPQEVGSTQLAKETIKKILNDNIFETPKPVELIKRLIRLNSGKEGVLLDFMAGSGTTGHAVLDLNKEDGGNRKFILCTNNDNQICEKVTFPRLEKVIKGYENPKGEKIEGLAGNLQYFQTGFVRKTSEVGTKIDITMKCTEMLCLKENIFNLEKETEDWKIFSSNKGDQHLCVYYNFIEKSFDDFVSEVAKIKTEKVVYIFTLKAEVDKKLKPLFENARLEAIPNDILLVYEEWVKKNVPMRSDLIFLEFSRSGEKIFEQKEKDEGARLLRIVLEKIILKLAKSNDLQFLKENLKEEKATTLNDKLKNAEIFSKVEWEENKTYLAIGNHAAHGQYDEYDLDQVKNFHKHIQNLLNKFSI